MCRCAFHQFLALSSYVYPCPRLHVTTSWFCTSHNFFSLFSRNTGSLCRQPYIFGDIGMYAKKYNFDLPISSAGRLDISTFLHLSPDPIDMSLTSLTSVLQVARRDLRLLDMAHP